MKAFTFYSESHKHLLDLLVNSFLRHSSIDLVIRKIPQECNGNYHSDGWRDSMHKKIQYVLDSLSMCEDGEIMIHIDSDIIINEGFDDYIENTMSEKEADIIFQWDSTGVCMGFFSCRNSPEVRSFFLELLKLLPSHIDDQHCANHLLRNEYKHLKSFIFDKNVYTIGIDHPMYSSGMSINIPANWKVFHANFTRNLKDKTVLLQSIASTI